MSTSSRKDIEFLTSDNNKTEGALKYNVAASSTLIYPGDPVTVTLGANQTVGLMATNKPVVGTDSVMGIAVSTSTNTASAAGTVMVVPLNSGDTLLITPNSAAAWDTQAEYDALVGARVLMDLTSAKYTILASDSANNGCVVQPLDITKYPAKVAFKFRAALSPTA